MIFNKIKELFLLLQYPACHFGIFTVVGCGDFVHIFSSDIGVEIITQCVDI